MANPIAKITLSDEKIITVELLPEHAPISVANFIRLVNEKFYDGLCFHRIINNFMIQGGGFIHEGNALKEVKKVPSIKGEFKINGVNNTLKHVPGVISMARTNVNDSASSQFFICAGDCSFLDGQYAAFGKTTDNTSLSNVLEIAKTPTGHLGYYGDVPKTPVVIKTIEIV